ncbi:MAG TPA: cytochrome c biogenesis protein ResB [Opitutus sp.]|nr:cytochrome c biogenesis protein ResB [Opitutus sp.]
MKRILRLGRDFLVSLQLTVVLLALSLVLIFAATLDQVNLGVWAVQAKYFRSFFVFWHAGDVMIPIFPGGYLIGGLLFFNLVAAHVYRFKFSWRKSGIWLTHAGLILLLAGEFFSGILQQEYQMGLVPGESKNFAESYRKNELAVIDTTDPQFDDVVAIPEKFLEHKAEIQQPRLPFRVVPRLYYPNAVLSLRSGATSDLPQLATKGVGPQLVVTPVPVTYKEDERNWPAAFVELIGPDGSLGTWLVSAQLAASQTFECAGHSFRLGLRWTRAYEPFSLTLLKVQHDVYPGTDIPKNFSSRVRINTPDHRGDREVLIYMNNPLRYSGLTFYQYQMNSENDTSVLQVVHNPSWLLPYISCALIVLGLLVQFAIHLTGFARKRRAAAAAAVP